MTENSELSQAEVIKTLRAAKWAMLTVVDQNGKLLSHPMTPQQVTEDADVWFFLGLAGDQATALQQHAQVNIAISEAGSWLSVSGTARFVQDRAKVDELWDGQVEAFFPGGKDDPNLGLLQVVSESAEYWGMPGGKVAALAQIVKSKVTGDRPAGGSATTEL